MAKRAPSKPATNVFQPGASPRTVRTAQGEQRDVPRDWVLLPPGDAALTRRVKEAGEHWLVQEKVGRRLFSRGIWAPAVTIETIRAALEAERSTAQYAKRQAASAQRREKIQNQYVEDFTQAVLDFLQFHPSHAGIAEKMAQAISEHATPVGSGTVARTERIPIERRAEAAAIAWMRHQTTGYDSMRIARVKGKRREVRRMLAEQSRRLLERYRNGTAIAATCPLAIALAKEEG